MTTLLGALLGFFTSMLPEILGLLRERHDRKHEITILEMQLKQQQMNQSERLEAIEYQADMAEKKALYRTYYSHVQWVDALNGTVRPVLAYAFFVLYVWVKAVTIWTLSDEMPYFAQLYQTLWTQEDAAIFAGIISFYFGQRALQKLRK